MLIQWCRPEPDFKCIPMAQALMRRGHEVQVLTGFPNYPGGRVYPGYRVRPWQKEVIEDVPVIRVALYPSHDRSSFRRACNYGSFALSASVLGPLLVRRPDVAYVYNPMGLPALVMKLVGGVPFCYDIADLWPDSLSASGMMRSKLMVRSLRPFFNFVYRQARHIITISPGFRRILLERGVPSDKVTVVYNWCDEANLRPQVSDPAAARRLGFADGLNIIYAGNIGKPQGLDVVLEAADLLRASHPEVLFTLIGRGTEAERLKSAAIDRGLTNVRFLPQIPPNEIGGVLAQADALLVHLTDDPLFRITIPSKVQAYMASGKPLLLGVAGDAAAIVAESGGGICFCPGNSVGLAQAVQSIAKMGARERAEMGTRAKQFYDSRLSLSAAAQQYESIFRRALGSPN